MVERDFIAMQRCGDDGLMMVRVSDITGICDHADQNGLVPGASTVFMREGLALSVNHTPAEIVELIKEKEVTQ